MVYNYTVKHNGVYYKPGENVPDDDNIKPGATVEYNRMNRNTLASVARAKGIDTEGLTRAELIEILQK